MPTLAVLVPEWSSIPAFDTFPLAGQEPDWGCFACWHIACVSQCKLVERMSCLWLDHGLHFGAHWQQHLLALLKGDNLRVLCTFITVHSVYDRSALLDTLQRCFSAQSELLFLAFSDRKKVHNYTNYASSKLMPVRLTSPYAYTYPPSKNLIS